VGGLAPTWLKDAKIDVEKMKDEKLLHEDGKKNFIDYTFKFLFLSCHLIFNFV